MADAKQYDELTTKITDKLDFPTGTSKKDKDEGKEYVADQINAAIIEANKLAKKQGLDLDRNDFTDIAKAVLAKKGTNDNKIEVDKLTGGKETVLTDVAIKQVVAKKALEAADKAVVESSDVADKLGYKTQYVASVAAEKDRILTSGKLNTDEQVAALAALKTQAESFKKAADPLAEILKGNKNKAAMNTEATNIATSLAAAAQLGADVKDKGDKATSAEKTAAVAAAKAADSQYTNFVVDKLKNDKDDEKAFKFLVHAAVEKAVANNTNGLKDNWEKVEDKKSFGALADLPGKTALEGIGATLPGAEKAKSSGSRLSSLLGGNDSEHGNTRKWAAGIAAASTGAAYLANRSGGGVDADGNPAQPSKFKKVAKLAFAAGAITALAIAIKPGMAQSAAAKLHIGGGQGAGRG